MDMEIEHESSDSDNQTDEDYHPNEPSDVSEVDSDDDMEDNEFEIKKQNNSSRSRKRTKKQPSIIKNKYQKLENEENKKNNKGISEEIHELDEKKRSDELWALFNNISSTTAATSIKKSTITAATSTTNTNTTKPNESISSINMETLYPFRHSSAAYLPNATGYGGGGGGGGGGLASVLQKIGKKTKVNCLEKSKSDWDSFKKREGIDEDLLTHNKGKDGFLEKKDFLERTDLKQFEIEKRMRQFNRSNR